MEHLPFIEQLTSSTLSPPTVIFSNRLSMHCIICSRKVSTGNEEDEGGANIPAAHQSVVEAPGFRMTFNEIWEILQKKQKGDIASDAEITLTTLTDLSKTTEVSFTEPPTMCQRCCDKVVCVENLIKAVRHQVREITMLFDQCSRTKETFEGQSEDRELDDPVEMQIKQDEWSSLEPGSLSQHSSANFLDLAPKLNDSSQAFTSFISEASCNETPMECDDGDSDKYDDVDDTKSEDPDYIKSEEENDDHDDDDDSEEIYSSSEDEEEQELVIPFKNTSDDLYSTPLPDPLANCSINLQRSIHSSDQSWSKTSPKFSSSTKKLSKPNQGPFICDVEGCRREVKTEKGLFFHKQKLHSDKSIMYPCDVPGCTNMFANPKSILRHKKDCHPDLEGTSSPSSSSSTQLICGLEGCSRVLQNEMGLFSHKRRCHPTIFNEELEKNKKENSPEFPCSCGRSFDCKKARYRHIVKNKAQHPEYKRDPRKDGAGQKCDICNEAIPFSEIFQHLSDHLNGKSEYVIKCPNDQCLHFYTNSKGLGKHVSNSQTECGKVGLERKIGLECESCGFSTSERLSLRNHVENHEVVLGTSEKIWGCPMTDCGKMFGVKQSMYFHLGTHRIEPISKISTQKCDKCEVKINVQGIEGHLKDKHGILEVIDRKSVV